MRSSSLHVGDRTIVNNSAVFKKYRSRALSTGWAGIWPTSFGLMLLKKFSARSGYWERISTAVRVTNMCCEDTFCPMREEIKYMFRRTWSACIDRNGASTPVSWKVQS